MSQELSQAPSRVPQEFNAIYEQLRTEVAWLHARWLTYRELYAKSSERIELLNECASTFFDLIHDVLVSDVQVTLSKLTDPARHGKMRENLSLEQLQEQLEKHDTSLAAICRTTLDRLHLQCSTFRIRRHKALTHWDLKTSLKTSAQPLPDVSRQMIEDALSSTRTYLNTIEKHYNDSTWAYEYFILNDGAEALLTILRNGLRYQDLVREDVLPFDDFRKGKWHDA